MLGECGLICSYIGVAPKLEHGIWNFAGTQGYACGVMIDKMLHVMDIEIKDPLEKLSHIRILIEYLIKKSKAESFKIWGINPGESEFWDKLRIS
jgi:hypothetical protein